MTQIKLSAKLRNEQGRSASRRLRRSGEIPAIIYGVDSEATLVTLEHNTVYYALKRENFHTSILSLDVDGKNEQVLLRDYQVHPFRQQVMHIDFQRVNEKEEVQMRIPLHFINEDICVAVKTQGAHITHVATDVEIRALAKSIPPFIDVDLKNIKAGQTVHLSDIALPDGVSLLNLLRGDDSVVAIAAGIVEEEIPTEDAVVSAADVPTIAGKKETTE